MLTSKQRSNLRSIAQKIEPITQVGKLGVNDALIEGNIGRFTVDISLNSLVTLLAT